MQVVRHPAKKAVDDLVALKAAARRYLEAVRSLGELSLNRVTYFEESVIKSAEAQQRWQELNDAGVKLASLAK